MLIPPLQGKGLLLTYWVRGKKDRKLPEQQAVLNPYQREVPTKTRFPKITPPPSRGESPASSPPLSPGPIQKQFLSIAQAGNITSSKKVSPEPHEWPQADRRLARRQEERRATIPDLVCQPLNVPPNSQLDRRSTLTTAEVGELQALLRAHGHRLSDVSQPPRPMTRSASDSSASIPNNQFSELNLMNIRGSISLPLAPILEGRTVSDQQLATFAAMAEENARQARRVADWASELAKVSRQHGSSVDVCPFHIPPFTRVPSDAGATPTIRTQPPTPELTEDRSLQQPPTTVHNTSCVVM